MKVAFDTSVLVASLFPAHDHHARAYVWLQAAKDGVIDGVVSLHAIAELWAKLTSIPRVALSAGDAAAVIDELKLSFAVIEPDEALYADAMSRCVAVGCKSGSIYDAIHLASARFVDADLMLTFNEKDFVRFERAGDPKVVVPPDPPALPLDL